MPAGKSVFTIIKRRTVEVVRSKELKILFVAIDVSDDLLKRFADSNSLDFSSVRKNYAPAILKNISEGIEIEFLGPYQQPDKLLVDWQQVSNIIQDVKRTGKQRAVEDPHTVYLKKDY